MSSEQAAKTQTEERARAGSGPRRFAEWLTFGISLALVASLAGFLVWRMREPTSELAFARVTPRFDAIQEQGGRFVLPVELSNPSRRTLRDVQLRVRRPGGSGTLQSVDVLVDYLGQSSSQTIYVYLHDDPRGAPIEVEALSYRVD